jgi:transcriptional regulator of acetoin/glycerol metabolism
MKTLFAALFAPICSIAFAWRASTCRRCGIGETIFHCSPRPYSLKSVPPPAKTITDLHPDSLQLLIAYLWPGNVRELKSAVEFAVISARTTCLMPADFPEELRHSQYSHLPPSFQESHSTEPKAHLLRALQQAQGNRTEAAKILGVSRATLYRRLLAHGIDVAE